MTQAAAAVVRRQILVQAPIERAFTVFTERFGDFKPPEHNLLAAAIAETVFEPRVGGHIYDRGVDGSEVEVRFVAESPQRTRVELEHRQIERHGPGWEAIRDGIADDAGWQLYLSRYAALFTKGS